MLTPYRFLNAAAANGASARTQTIRGKRYNVLTFAGGNTAQVNGYINDRARMNSP